MLKFAPPTGMMGIDKTQQKTGKNRSLILSHDLVGLFVPPVGLARCSVRYLPCCEKLGVKGCQLL